MKQTPLQKLIDGLSEGLQVAINEGNLGAGIAFQHSLNEAKSLLPYEREVIEKAYNRGWNERHFEVHTDYYTQTFNTDEQ